MGNTGSCQSKVLTLSQDESTVTEKHGDHLSSKPRPAAVLREVLRSRERREGNFVDRMEAFMLLQHLGEMREGLWEPSSVTTQFSP